MTQRSETKTLIAMYIGTMVVIVTAFGILAHLIWQVRTDVKHIRTQIEEIHDTHFMQPVPARTPYPNNDPSDPVCGDPAALHKH